VSFEKIEDEFGKDYLKNLKKASEKFIDEGLLIIEEGILKATQNGKFLVDGIASELFKI